PTDHRYQSLDALLFLPGVLPGGHAPAEDLAAFSRAVPPSDHLATIERLGIWPIRHRARRLDSDPFTGFVRQPGPERRRPQSPSEAAPVAATRPACPPALGLGSCPNSSIPASRCSSTSRPAGRCGFTRSKSTAIASRCASTAMTVDC